MNHAGAMLRQYTQIGLQTAVESASPHRLIQMLLEGAQSRITAAIGHMQRGVVPEKGRNIGLAISIIEGLRSSLDLTAGGEIAANLDSLYEYMNRRLLEANLHNDAKRLEEVHGLLSEITSGWVEMGAQLSAAQAAG